MMNRKIDVIIPLYKPDKKLDKLLEKLVMQTVLPHKIILLNTECFPDYATAFVKERIAKLFHKIKVLGKSQIEVQIVSIVKEEFDHGGTRAYASTLSDADYIVYMTQDAIPKDFRLLSELVKPFEDPEVAVVYGKQEANINSNVIEQYTRMFNYPSTDKKKTKADYDKLGIKTFFSSDVCAAYRKDIYEELGGFVHRTIFNEDMIFAKKAVDAGYAVYYAAQAKVIHSHDYGLMEQLRRNFDLGVSQREYKEVFSKVSSEKEGIKLVKQTLTYLYDQKKYIEIFEFVMESGFKYIGYSLGKRYTYLPHSLCQWLSTNKAYWR